MFDVAEIRQVVTSAESVVRAGRRWRDFEKSAGPTDRMNAHQGFRGLHQILWFQIEAWLLSRSSTRPVPPEGPPRDVDGNDLKPIWTAGDSRWLDLGQRDPGLRDAIEEFQRAVIETWDGLRSRDIDDGKAGPDWTALDRLDGATQALAAVDDSRMGGAVPGGNPHGLQPIVATRKSLNEALEVSATNPRHLENLRDKGVLSFSRRGRGKKAAFVVTMTNPEQHRQLEADVERLT